MTTLETCKKAWALLDARERRNAWITLSVVIMSGISSAMMVGSVFPFLSVLSDPSRIEQEAALIWVYETFGFSDDYAFLVALGVASFVVIVASLLIQIAKTYVLARFSMMRSHSISHRLLSSYLRQTYPLYLNRHSGDLSTRVLSETMQVVLQFLRPASEVIASTVTVVAIITLLIWVNPTATFLAFGLLGGIYAGVYALSRRLLKRTGYVRSDANRERFRIASDALGGFKDIKLLGLESEYAARYAGPSRRMARALVIVQLLSQVPQFAVQAVAFGGVILLCLVLMDKNALASGTALGGILPTLGVFAFAGQRLMPELSRLYSSLAQLDAGSAAVHVVYDDLVMDSGPVAPPCEAPHALGLRQRLELKSVSYRYPNAELPGLCDISLEIRAGERIGIVGTTGAGKTTLADVILGLLPPSKGQIRSDGRPIGGVDLRAWQQSVGYVPQDIFLIDASISENIAFGVPLQNIDEARVRKAAEIARLDGFIRDDLSDDYTSVIGERGVRLSGGQRQRIGIARAIYRDADLIVFDEATSALDNVTERDVMEAIGALPGEKTVIMVAHRLSTVKRCDRIIVLDKGCLVGYDTWEKLMSENATFRKLANVTAVR